MVAVRGSMMPMTASTAIGLIVSQFWLTTFDDRQVSTAWISVSLQTTTPGRQTDGVSRDKVGRMDGLDGTKAGQTDGRNRRDNV